MWRWSVRELYLCSVLSFTSLIAREIRRARKERTQGTHIPREGDTKDFLSFTVGSTYRCACILCKHVGSRRGRQSQCVVDVQGDVRM